MKLQAALAKFQFQLEADGRSIHTRRQYTRHIKLFDRWLASQGYSGEIEEIDHELIAIFLTSDEARLRPDGKPKKATAMNGLRSSLRTFFGYMHAAGFIPVNPARLLRRAQTGTPPPRALSETEQARLLDALDQAEGDAEIRDRVLITLLLMVGLRIGSALALRVEDLDLGSGEIWLTSVKNDRRERLFIPRDIVPLLRDWIIRIGDGWLFPGRGGRPMTTRHASRRFGRWADRAGLRSGASLHSLRHSFAMRLYGLTGDLGLVQRALTHQSIVSTLVYAKCPENRLRAAVGA